MFYWNLDSLMWLCSVIKMKANSYLGGTLYTLFWGGAERLNISKCKNLYLRIDEYKEVCF